MKINKKFITLVFVFCFFVFLSSGVFPYVNCNGAGNGYEGDTEGGESVSNSVEYYIILGAAYFLDANTHIQAALGIVETKDLWGLDTYRLKIYLDYAAYNFQAAVEAYTTLLERVEPLPYNPVVQARLITFDYDRYARENNLNKSVFDEVKSYLIKGDINGVFKRTHYSLTLISRQLETIRTKGYTRDTLDVVDYRRLNESCAETSLFGSYVARVFAQIR